MDHRTGFRSVFGTYSAMPLCPRWGSYMHEVEPQARENCLMHLESSSDEDAWLDIVCELDERLEETEAAIISHLRYRYEEMWQSSLVFFEDRRRQILAALEFKLAEIVEQKMQEMKRQMCQKVEEKLQAMEERIKTAERLVVNRRGNMEVDYVEEQPGSSQDNTETDFCSKVMLKMGEMEVRLAVLEAATRKSVVHFFPKVDAMLKHLSISP